MGSHSGRNNTGNKADVVGIVPIKSDLVKNTDVRQDTFCNVYAQVGTISAAAKSCAIDPSTIYAWANSDSYGFKKKFERAKQSFADSLETLAFERVKTRDTNDLLLITLLNSHKPEKYRPNTQSTNEQATEVIAKLTRLTRKSAGGQEETVEIAEVRG